MLRLARWGWLTLALLAAWPAAAGPLAERLRERWQAGQAEARAAGLPDGVRMLSALRYGDDPAETLDAYLPAQPQHAPLVLMVHGGGWRLGDKGAPAVFLHKVQRWAPQGVIVLSVNYPLLPHAAPTPAPRRTPTLTPPTPWAPARRCCRRICHTRRSTPSWVWIMPIPSRWRRFCGRRGQGIERRKHNPAHLTKTAQANVCSATASQGAPDAFGLTAAKQIMRHQSDMLGITP